MQRTLYLVFKSEILLLALFQTSSSIAEAANSINKVFGSVFTIHSTRRGSYANKTCALLTELRANSGCGFKSPLLCNWAVSILNTSVCVCDTSHVQKVETCIDCAAARGKRSARKTKGTNPVSLQRATLWNDCQRENSFPSPALGRMDAKVSVQQPFSFNCEVRHFSACKKRLQASCIQQTSGGWTECESPAFLSTF